MKKQHRPLIRRTTVDDINSGIGTIHVLTNRNYALYWQYSSGRFYARYLFSSAAYELGSNKRTAAAIFTKLVRGESPNDINGVRQI